MKQSFIERACPLLKGNYCYEKGVQKYVLIWEAVLYLEALIHHTNKG